MEEIWKPVKGFEGLYDVSSLGNVRSHKRFSTSGGLRKIVIKKNGCCQISLSKRNKIIQKSVPILVAEHFIENPNDKPQVCHKNDIKTDNRIENLYWGTQLENEADKKRNGNTACGEKIGSHKLNEKQVRVIKHLKNIKPRMILIEVGEVFGISIANVQKIWVGESWKHVKI